MKTQRLLLSVSALLVLLVAGGLWLWGQEAVAPSRTSQQTAVRQSPGIQAGKEAPLSTATASTPSIPAPTVAPSLITVNTSTAVTVTTQITGPTPIPGSVNLLRIGATGTQPTVLGVMHDDGKNGDAAAGDGVYTLQIPFNEPAPINIHLQVSAAYNGRLQRTLSPISTLPIWGVVRDQTEGFSAQYPPGLYASIPADVPGQHLIESSALDVDLGGAAAPDQAQTAPSGYAIAITSIRYAAPFTIAQYLADIHPYDPIDSIAPVTISGVQAYTVIFKDEIGAGEPTTFVPAAAAVLEISYSSTYALGSIQDQGGLSAYVAVLKTLVVN